MESNVREAVRKDLRGRPEPLTLYLDSLTPCPRNEYVGKFPSYSDYDRVISEDCDVYVGGEKVISFRKALLPALRDGSSANPEVWAFLRQASREVYGTQRGVVAGTEMTTRLEARLTKGQVAFFTQAAAGLITTLEQAREVLRSSDEYTTKTVKTKQVKKLYPGLRLQLQGIERDLKRENLTEEEKCDLMLRKREAVWGWFDPWLTVIWSASPDKVATTKALMDEMISSQLNFNHCYSNVLGAIDRGARFPYGRLSGTTQRNYDMFHKFRPIYWSACEGFRECFPDTWVKVRDVISRAKDPVYTLFGTAFTSVTINFNFRTAYHYDKNNLHGGLAVLSAITKGSYDGHYLVFPEVRLAFDLRDGDFIIGDTQKLLHGNTPMENKSEDAERVSLVFYSRENMALLDDLECEQCRREFMKFSANDLTDKSKSHKEWRGVWPGMWTSQEWWNFRAERSLEHCSNSNWQLSSPYRNTETGEVSMHKRDPGEGWELVQIYTPDPKKVP